MGLIVQRCSCNGRKRRNESCFLRSSVENHPIDPPACRSICPSVYLATGVLRRIPLNARAISGKIIY